jgi:hypothetical protein
MPAFTPQALDGVINAAGWTAISAPGDFDHVVISNKNGAVGMKLRTAQGDVSTELPIAAGVEQPIAVPPPRVNTKPGAAGTNYRFRSGVVAFYLKADSGTGTGAFLLWA